jgi:hypothetical protein
MRATLLRQNLDNPDHPQRPGGVLGSVSFNLRERILAYCPHQTFSHGLGHERLSSIRSAVGTAITDRPPLRSVQAGFPHTAPALGA